MAIGGVAANTGGVGDATRQDIRFKLDKKRAQDLLRAKGLLPPLPVTVTANGEIDAIRSAIAQGEGFTMPVNFKVEFYVPTGLVNKSGLINPGGLDAQTHIMNGSNRYGPEGIHAKWNQAKQVGQSNWVRRKPGLGESGPFSNGKVEKEEPRSRMESKINLFCSTVSVPDRVIPQGLYRHYGSSWAQPNSAMTYGALSTTFYCDATMSIKKFFDAWQNLIYNPMTGNFNYYDEYTSKFDVFTRSTTKAANKGGMAPANEASGWVKTLQEAIQDGSKAVDEFFGTDKNIENRSDKQGTVPMVEFNNTYGCRIFECWPQTVGAVSLSHGGGGSVATFDVTWAYKQWSPFQMNGVTNRPMGTGLVVGEMRNEKDGIPFLEDLPPELAGPIGGAAQQAFNTSPASKGSNMFG